MWSTSISAENITQNNASKSAEVDLNEVVSMDEGEVTLGGEKIGRSSTEVHLGVNRNAKGQWIFQRGFKLADVLCML